jgi:hypothetical protein
MTQRVEGGRSRAQQRRRVDGAQPVGNPNQPGGNRDHRFGISAIDMSAGTRLVRTVDEIPAAAIRAYAAVPAEVADAHALADLPSGHSFAERVDFPDGLMAGNAGMRDAGHERIESDRVGMADPARFHADANSPRSRIEQRAIDEVELSGRGDLNSAIGGHGLSLWVKVQTSRHCVMKASISSLTRSLCVVAMPWGKPAYTFPLHQLGREHRRCADRHDLVVVAVNDLCSTRAMRSSA